MAARNQRLLDAMGRLCIGTHGGHNSKHKIVVDQTRQNPNTEGEGYLAINNGWKMDIFLTAYIVLGKFITILWKTVHPKIQR